MNWHYKLTTYKATVILWSMTLGDCVGGIIIIIFLFLGKLISFPVAVLVLLTKFETLKSYKD